MGINFIIGGIFFWIMITLVRYIFSKPSKVISIDLLREVIKMDLNYKSENFGPSFLQLTGLYWLLMGIFLQGFQIEFPDFNLNPYINLFIFGAPFLFGSLYLEKKKKK